MSDELEGLPCGWPVPTETLLDEYDLVNESLASLNFDEMYEIVDGNKMIDSEKVKELVRLRDASRRRILERDAAQREHITKLIRYNTIQGASNKTKLKENLDLEKLVKEQQREIDEKTEMCLGYVREIAELNETIDVMGEISRRVHEENKELKDQLVTMLMRTKP